MIPAFRLSLLVNVLLLILSSYFYVRLATAVSRLMLDIEHRDVAAFTYDEEILISRVREQIVPSLANVNNFYVSQLQWLDSDSARKMNVSAGVSGRILVVQLSPVEEYVEGYRIRLDGFETTIPSRFDYLGPTYFYFSEDFKLIKVSNTQKH